MTRGVGGKGSSGGVKDADLKFFVAPSCGVAPEVSGQNASVSNDLSSIESIVTVSWRCSNLECAS